MDAPIKASGGLHMSFGISVIHMSEAPSQSAQRLAADEFARRVENMALSRKLV